MKHKTILFLLSLIIVLSSQIKAQKQQEYILTCQFKGLPDRTKVYLTTQEIDTVDRAISNGDRFTFKGKLDPEGRFLFINFDTLVTKATSKAIFVANQSITVQGTIGTREVEVIGSPEQGYYRLSQDLGKKFAQQVDESERLIALKDKAINDNATLTGIERALELKRIGDEALKVRDSVLLKSNIEYKNWLIRHKESLYAPYALKFMMGNMELSHAKEIFLAFPKRVQESYYGRLLKLDIESSALVNGSVIPNFTLKNLQGKTESLHNLINGSKYTLIDCWASWCKPCRAEVPKLKMVYDKYKSKGLNIVGISSDKREADWKKAVADDKTAWSHVLELDGNLTKSFRLRAIPAYILVDRDGKLVAFDCAMSSIASFGGGLRGEDLDKKLEELLGK